VSIKPQTVQAATLYLVATPIGNLADISQRALDVLQQVDAIAAEDTRNTRKLLNFYSIDNQLFSLHEHNEDLKAAAIIERLQNQQSIALVSDAGTPLISDPGYKLVALCRQQGLDVVPVPGPSALITALSASGLATDKFCFCGFPPRQSGKRRDFFQTWSKIRATLIFYESSHRIVECMQDAIDVFGAERNACLARELTKMFETFLTGSLQTVFQQLCEDSDQTRGEFVLMVEAAVEEPTEQAGDIDIDKMLSLLCEALPIKKAAAITAQITGLKKNSLYQRALELKTD